MPASEASTSCSWPCPPAPITALGAVALPTDSSQPFSTSPRTPLSPSLMPPAPTAHAPQQPPSSLPATPPHVIAAAASSITSNSMVAVTASTSNAAATAMPHPLQHVVVDYDSAENGSVAISYQWHQLQSDYWILRPAAATPHPAPSFSGFSYEQDRDEQGMHCEEAL